MGKQLDTWKGRTINELYLYWGIPESLQTLSDGQVVAVYSYYEGPKSNGQYLACQIKFLIKNNVIKDKYYAGDLDLLNKFMQSAPAKAK